MDNYNNFKMPLLFQKKSNSTIVEFLGWLGPSNLQTPDKQEIHYFLHKHSRKKKTQKTSTQRAN